ncbi:MAG: hypothetical protein US70_C0015G0008 [Parcubacteria group bacterium GW2011_GWD2_38_11]|nr:MAG: hypothetical protein US70_C0015G0008 [Parcubacteria group bacterium GW2011_GWD2_38_11]
MARISVVVGNRLAFVIQGKGSHNHVIPPTKRDWPQGGSGKTTNMGAGLNSEFGCGVNCCGVCP